MKKVLVYLILIALVALSGAISCAQPEADDDHFKVTLPPPAEDPLPNPTPNPSPVIDWQSIYEDNIRSIPQIVVEECYLQSGYCQDYLYGTAFVIAPGVVATNYHLGEYCYLIETQETETIYYQIYLRYPATTDSEDNYFLPGNYYVTGCYGLSDRDMALLRVDTLGNTPVRVVTEDFWSLQSGDKVFLVGYPGWQDFVGSSGEINDLFLNEGLAGWISDDTKLIEHTAYTYYGSSGSPVFNDSGQLIGIHFAGYNNTSDFSLALSIDYLRGLNYTALPFYVPFTP